MAGNLKKGEAFVKSIVMIILIGIADNRVRP
jgi:hypothetical protein